jgi:hypothetical protein
MVNENVQLTSLEAFETIKKELGPRQKIVYEAIKSMGEANNLMISKHLGLPINVITPRVLEIRGKKLVGVSKIDKCPYTRRNSIWWKVVK